MSTLPTENLGTIISSAKARQIVYAVFVLAIIIAGGVQVFFSAVGLSQPSWLTGAVAVLAYLGAPVGALALANVSSKTLPVNAP